MTSCIKCGRRIGPLSSESCTERHFMYTLEMQLHYRRQQAVEEAEMRKTMGLDETNKITRSQVGPHAK